MSGFSCPHYDFASERCMRLDAACVPGRPGCVLCGKVGFIDDTRDRIARREARLGKPAKGRRTNKEGGDRA